MGGGGMTVKENFVGQDKFVNLCRSIVKTADKEKEKQIGRSSKTYDPIYGKAVTIVIPTETLEEMRREISEYEKMYVQK